MNLSDTELLQALLLDLDGNFKRLMENYENTLRNYAISLTRNKEGRIILPVCGSKLPSKKVPSKFSWLRNNITAATTEHQGYSKYLKS